MSLLCFDLDQYIQKYSGHTKLLRLLFIAEHEENLRLQAWKLAIEALKNGSNTKLYKQICDQVGGQLGESYCIDYEFIDSTDRKAMQRLERLGQELNSYKTNLMKDSIRIAYNELGSFYLQKGDLALALKSYARTRDYCTTTKHIVDMCLGVIKAGILMGNFTSVNSYVSKAEQAMAGGELDDPIVSSKLSSALGLVHLENRRYKQAALSFLKCTVDVASKFNDVIHDDDIAMYGGLCATASFSRDELKVSVVDNPSFKQFLELVPRLREFIHDFYSSRYTSCLEFLLTIKPELLLDMHLHHHLDELYSQIRNRAIIQYFSPYLSVDITTMAASFNSSADKLEQELSNLIMDGKIIARIDSHNKILYARQADQRNLTYRKAFRVGKKYLCDTKALLLRLNVLKHDFVVSSNRVSSRLQG